MGGCAAAADGCGELTGGESRLEFLGVWARVVCVGMLQINHPCNPKIYKLHDQCSDSLCIWHTRSQGLASQQTLSIQLPNLGLQATMRSV